jgi:3-oxoadipate enol-lactonase
MVLLHALGSSGSSWVAFAEVLGESYRVYVPDMRGHGASDWPGTYSFELMRDDVLGFLDVLGLDRVTLVGHSMGGVTALLFAEEHSDRLVRLVIEDTPIPLAGGDPVPVRPRPDHPVDFDWPAIAAIVGQLNSPDPSWWDKLSDIRVPTLVVAGGPDSPLSQDWIAKAAGRIPDCTLVTIPVGHQVHRDRPAEFSTAVRSFLGAG